MHLVTLKIAAQTIRHGHVKLTKQYKDLSWNFRCVTSNFYYVCVSWICSGWAGGLRFSFASSSWHFLCFSKSACCCILGISCLGCQFLGVGFLWFRSSWSPGEATTCSSPMLTWWQQSLGVWLLLPAHNGLTESLGLAGVEPQGMSFLPILWLMG